MSQRKRCLIFLLFYFLTTIILISYFVCNKTSFTSRKDLMKAKELCDNGLISEPSFRPLIVMGILSSNNNREKRDVLRRTWLATIKKTARNLPFRVVYKFYLDNKTLDTEDENKLNDDLVYLNVSDHVYRYRFGRKVYIMIKNIYMTYPEVNLGIRIDDDVFLCVPQVFNELKKIINDNLYYGWKWNNGPIDEMFVVLGHNVIKWLSGQVLCTSNICSNKTLKETDLGSTSLQNWLKKYKNVKIITDNKKIKHVKITPNSSDWIKFAVPEYCKNHIVFHRVKVSPFMNVMHRNNEVLKAKGFNSISVSGNSFSGVKDRVLPSTRFTNNLSIAVSIEAKYKCLFWAVVTTVFEPSKSLKYITDLHEWCLVIVADIKTPTEKQFLSKLEPKTYGKIKFLSVEEQMHLYPLLSEYIPLNSFARKNIGYMYAIQNKAKLIWDFDDDNVGIISRKGFSTLNDYLIACEMKTNIHVINTYPYFVRNNTRVWPRGFPLELLKNDDTIPKICTKKSKIELGIIQSLANVEADVDAIYRLTSFPFNFTTKPDIDKLLVLPRNIYTPFNAQATLWFPEAFKYLALPISVAGRVTDIWRSYIAEHFFYKNDLQISFSPPYVYHNRTKHNLMGDFHAETPLYEQSGKLVKLLSSSVYQDLVSLYDDLYQRRFIEEEDLMFIRAWNATFHFVN